jgi:hypothetical protein
VNCFQIGKSCSGKINPHPVDRGKVCVYLQVIKNVFHPGDRVHTIKNPPGRFIRKEYPGKHVANVRANHPVIFSGKLPTTVKEADIIVFAQTVFSPGNAKESLFTLVRVFFNIPAQPRPFITGSQSSKRSFAYGSGYFCPPIKKMKIPIGSR